MDPLLDFEAIEEGLFLAVRAKVRAFFLDLGDEGAATLHQLYALAETGAPSVDVLLGCLVRMASREELASSVHVWSVTGLALAEVASIAEVPTSLRDPALDNEEVVVTPDMVRVHYRLAPARP